MSSLTKTLSLVQGLSHVLGDTLWVCICALFVWMILQREPLDGSNGAQTPVVAFFELSHGLPKGR